MAAVSVALSSAGVSPALSTPDEYQRRVAEVAACLPEGAYLVGIAGVPGSGKSTLAGELARQVPGAVVVPMDGYHIRRAELTAEELARRGAPWTFAAERFRRELAALKAERRGVFPAFAHVLGDPVEAEIEVTASHRVVLVEGLYLLTKSWEMEELFDFTIFIDVGVDEAMRRVVARQVATRSGLTVGAAEQRVAFNDRENARLVLEDGGRERADLKLEL